MSKDNSYMSISISDVGDIISSFSKSCDNIKEIFERIDNSMKKIDGTDIWNGSTQKEVYLKYLKLKEQFDKINSSFSSRVDFLNNVVSNYSEAGLRFNNNVDNNTFI